MSRIGKPVSTVNEVLIDLLEDNQRRLKRLLERVDDECIYWAPNRETNSIATTMWHMGRLFDVFFTRQALGKEPVQERWFSGGWSKKAGYDPRGIGRDGWGSLNDYTADEVAAMPHMPRELLLGYLDDIYDTVKAYLQATPNETLQELAPGFDGKFSQYQCIQMALMDNVRHLGEIYAIKAYWDRESKY